MRCEADKDTPKFEVIFMINPKRKEEIDKLQIELDQMEICCENPDLITTDRGVVCRNCATEISTPLFENYTRSIVASSIRPQMSQNLVLKQSKNVGRTTFDKNKATGRLKKAMKWDPPSYREMVEQEANLFIKMVGKKLGLSDPTIIDLISFYMRVWSEMKNKGIKKLVMMVATMYCFLNKEGKCFSIEQLVGITDFEKNEIRKAIKKTNQIILIIKHAENNTEINPALQNLDKQREKMKKDQKKLLKNLFDHYNSRMSLNNSVYLLASEIIERFQDRIANKNALIGTAIYLATKKLRKIDNQIPKITQAKIKEILNVSNITIQKYCKIIKTKGLF